MTEEIIIDGVNVSECVYCSKTNNTIICSDYITGLCEDYNCRYKQIKRLEQERDELKQTKDKYYQQTLDNEITISDLIEEIQELKADRTLERISKLSTENARLEQENRALKDNNNHLQAIIDDGRAENKRFREENERLKETVKSRENELANMAEQANMRINNYRSALEEIKEDIEQDTTCESRECGCDDYAECLNCIKETTLDKINEVLNEN